ncbi:MAG: GntR family transcriptional regulator [Verrucomicrobia bacterium]|nr:GntR family transcriptional regulator [Verrucomicrobiota bacterium]
MSEPDNEGFPTENAHTQRAYEFIRQKILGGAYSPGYRLKTLVLAKESGVSRTPVREALRQLQSEGLVDILPRLGASVRAVNFAQFKEMCEVRLALESFSAEQAARNREPEDIIDLEEAYREMEKLVAALEQVSDSEKLLQELVAQDIRFHLAVLKAAGNSLLKAEVLRLHLFSRLVRLDVGKMPEGSRDQIVVDTPERRRWVLSCHHKIFLAIQKGEPEAAGRAMHEHLRDIIDRGVMAMARAQKRREERAVPHSGAFYATNN